MSNYNRNKNKGYYGSGSGSGNYDVSRSFNLKDKYESSSKDSIRPSNVTEHHLWIFSIYDIISHTHIYTQ